MLQRGFSLIELIVVLVVISALVSMSTLAFNSYNRKYGMELQTKKIFAEMTKHRAEALYCKKRQAVRFTSQTFALYSSEVTTCDPVVKHQLTYPLTNNNLKICFDEQGLAGTRCSICIAENGNGAASDSLVISTTRIQMGKRKSEASCNSESIVTR